MSQHCLPPNVMHKEHSHFCSISVKYAWLISDHEEIRDTQVEGHSKEWKAL